MPRRNFVLITNQSESNQWSQALQNALVSLGNLKIHSEEFIKRGTSLNSFDLIIVDARTSLDLGGFVKALRDSAQETPIIVIFAAPSWKQMREAFRAGVNDCIDHLMSEKEFEDSINRQLK